MTQSQASAVTLSGLLNCIDGIAAQEGRLLFATTNKYSALDPALLRPGRLDVHIRFDNAGKWQIEELFRSFFSPCTNSDISHCGCKQKIKECSSTLGRGNVQFLVYNAIVFFKTNLSGWIKWRADTKSVHSRSLYTDNLGRHECSTMCTINPDLHGQQLTCYEVNKLAKEFALRIPDRKFSMAAIQGLLMQYKTRPHLAVDEVNFWLESEKKKEVNTGEITVDSTTGTEEIGGSCGLLQSGHDVENSIGTHNNI